MTTENPFARFPAREYLKKYYSYVGEENQSMMRALAQFARRFGPRFERVVEVGGGPSVVPILSLCATLRRTPTSITFTDISHSNLSEVESWLHGRPTSFDYTGVLDWLSREHAIERGRIATLTRAAHWNLQSIDFEQAPPRDLLHAFDTVSSHFFAESATADERTLSLLLHHVAQLAAPGARIFMSFMRRSLGYAIDGIDFPAVAVDEQSLPGLLYEAGFNLADMEVITIGTETPPTRPGYEGMVFMGGVLRPA